MSSMDSKKACVGREEEERRTREMEWVVIAYL